MSPSTPTVLTDGEGDKAEPNSGVLDLTADPPIGEARSPETIPYDPAPAREKIRGAIALGLFCLLSSVVLASLVALWTGGVQIGPLKELLGVVFAPLVALVGAATGFYFGGRRS